MRLRFLIISLVYLLCISCAGRRQTVDVPLCRIATLKGPSSMGMIQMIDSLESSSQIQIDILNEPMQVRKMMLEGSADFAVLPSNLAAVLYNKGMAYVLAAIPVSGTLYLAGTDSSLSSWHNVKGQRVNVMAKGMTPDALFRYLLIQNGLEADLDVTLDYSFPTHTDLANAMLAGRVTSGIISEPYLSLVMAKNPAIKPLIDLSSEWNKTQGIPIAETALLVSKKWLKSHPDLYLSLLDSYRQSTEWVNHNPDSAAVLIVKHGIVPDVQVARNAIDRSHLEFRRAKDHKDQIETYLRVLYTVSPDIIGGKMPDEAFYQ